MENRESRSFKNFLSLLKIQQMIRVYPSSKVKHAPMWRKLQQEVPHVFFNARWIKRAEKESELKNDDFRDLWKECRQDIEDADALLVYAEDGDHLKGELVEVGMALASNVKVILVTSIKDKHVYGTWMHADQVDWATAMDEALSLLYAMTDKGKREEKKKFIDEFLSGVKR